jgi:AraC-like DNA-binding protein
MPTAAQSQSAHSLVELAEVLALAVSNTPPHISALCRALGVSERTLRKEFHKTYGITPCRRLRLLRLTREIGTPSRKLQVCDSDGNCDIFWFR